VRAQSPKTLIFNSLPSTEISAFNALRPLNGLVWIYPQYLLSFAKQ